MHELIHNQASWVRSGWRLNHHDLLRPRLPPPSRPAKRPLPDVQGRAREPDVQHRGGELSSRPRRNRLFSLDYVGHADRWCAPQEFAEQGVRVNCVSPGLIWGPIVYGSFHDNEEMMVRPHGPSSSSCFTCCAMNELTVLRRPRRRPRVTASHQPKPKAQSGTVHSAPSTSPRTSHVGAKILA